MTGRTRRGVKALDDHRWNDAVTAFDQAASGKGKRADAALYWKAYALNKLGRADLAGATCGQLGRCTTRAAGTRTAGR